MMKEKIHAVSDKDLNGLLESLGLVEQLEKQVLLCNCCGKKLSKENIGCLYPLGNEIGLCCNDLKCLEKVLEEITPLRRISNKKEEDHES